MRIAALLPCLLLTACLSDGGPPPPTEAAAPAVPATPSAMAGAPSGRRATGGGSAAGGGASTASARGEPVELGSDPLTQARADCWMKVEHEKAMRDIDRRSAFVDKCVTDTMKGKPPP
jgi:hypothetical protein